MNITITTTQQDDGRWLATALETRGVLVYAPSRTAAEERATVLASCVLAERIEHSRDGIVSPA